MSSLEQGLSEREAQKRLSENGPNVLREQKGKNCTLVFLGQLNDPLIYVLAVAAMVSLLLKEYSDALIILAVVMMNALIGTIQEGKARKALDALKSMQSPMAVVIRDGKQREIPASHVVHGDLVCLEAGARVPADLTLVEAASLMTEESALTGESLPVEKIAAERKTQCEDVAVRHSKGKDASVGNEQWKNAAEDKRLRKKGTDENKNEKAAEDGLARRDRAYMSTMVTAGKGKGIVIGTGMHTEIGKIAEMIRGEKEEVTPLQRRLGELGTYLSLLSLLLCGALFGIAVLQKRDVMQMLITAISLAVAAVPEGLPAVVTICLALSVTRMVKAGTIVRKLPSVEALGAVGVVCSDKTGTLTQNQVKVVLGFWNGAVRRLEEAPPKEYLLGWVLCNNAGPQMGDPTEQALLEMGRRFGYDQGKLQTEFARSFEVPFTSESRQMMTFHRDCSGEEFGYCKGAAEEVLKKCYAHVLQGRRVPLEYHKKQEILHTLEKMASLGYRTLALAKREGGGVLNDSRDWTFLGLVAMEDPPRPEAADAVSLLRVAGVETVMITGDHAKTAFAIGKRLGIATREAQIMTGERLLRLSEEELAREMERRDLRIFARVSPAQKVQIVKAFQKRGKIVAMTGDGVNDAPSLKAADIGIAMGKNGTDVAKEAADLVLTDDNFATIERAVEEGRGVYENIRKSVIFLLSSNLGELLTMLVAVICGMASPLKSCHVLWINLITDSLPALALGVDPNDGKELMKFPPRRAKESLFARGGWECTCFYGILIAAISLFAFRLSDNVQQAQTYAFTVLGMSQLFHAIGMRDVNLSIFRRKPFENKVMIFAFVMGLLLQLAVTEIPMLVAAFGTMPLSLAEWLMLTALSAAPLLAHEVVLLFAPSRN